MAILHYPIFSPSSLIIDESFGDYMDVPSEALVAFPSIENCTDIGQIRGMLTEITTWIDTYFPYITPSFPILSIAVGDIEGLIGGSKPHISIWINSTNNATVCLMRMDWILTPFIRANFACLGDFNIDPPVYSEDTYQACGTAADWPLNLTIEELVTRKNDFITALINVHEPSAGFFSLSFKGILESDAADFLNTANWDVSSIVLDSSYAGVEFKMNIAITNPIPGGGPATYKPAIRIPAFTTNTTPPPPSSIKFGDTSVTTSEQALKNLQANHAAINVFNNNSGLGASSFVPNQDYPIFQDNLSHYVPWATLKSFVAGTLNLGWTQGSFDLPDSGGQTQKMLPSQLTAIAGELTQVDTNTNDFFTKQEHVWEAEARFFDFIVKEIEDRCRETKITYSPITPLLPNGITEDSQTFGPFVALTRDSESNKGYKYNNLAGWAYRSLIKTVEFEIIQRTIAINSLYQLTAVEDIYSGYYDGAQSQSKSWTQPLKDSLPVFESFGEVISIANLSIWKAWALANLPTLGIEGGGIGFDTAEEVFSLPLTSDNYRWTQFPQVGHIEVNLEVFVLGGWKFTLGNTYDVSATYSVSYLLNKSESQISPCVTTNLGFTKIIGHGRYDLLGVFTQTDATPGAYTIPDPCAPDAPVLMPRVVYLADTPVANPRSLLNLDTTIDGQAFTLVPQSLILPPVSFLLQDGSPAPLYPTFQGAFVYDTHLEKWGKFKGLYKQILDYSPINDISSGIIPYDVFGIDGGILQTDGFISLFDNNPSECFLKWGKIGFYRQGFTDVEEIRVDFRELASGLLTIEASLDGRNIEPALEQNQSFDSVNQTIIYGDISARWFNIKISGSPWDIVDMDFQGHKKGKR